MKYTGTGNAVRGTAGVGYGSPKPLLDCFRALPIPEQMQQEFGSPAPDDTAEAKIFGLNAARLHDIDVAAKRCQVDACPTAQLRRRLDEEFGTGRWTVQEPGGPKTWDEYVQ